MNDDIKPPSRIHGNLDDLRSFIHSTLSIYDILTLTVQIIRATDDAALHADDAYGVDENIASLIDWAEV